MTSPTQPEVAHAELTSRSAARRVDPQTVAKPWGREVIFAATDRFAGKLLEIRAGERLSMHFHRDKHEMLLVLRGAVRIVTGEDSAGLERHDLAAGQAFELPPGTVHRIEAAQDSLLVEASSPEIEDVVRLSDDYGRAAR